MGGNPPNASIVNARRLRLEPGVDFSFDPATHIYTAGGVRVPSVTQVLGILHLGADFSRVDPDVLEHKRQLGVLVHDACAILDEDDDLDWDSLGLHGSCLPPFENQRLAVRLKPNGTYKLHTFTDLDDPGAFKSALHLACWLPDTARNSNR